MKTHLLKKTISILIAASLAASLAACSSSDTTDDGSETTSEADTAEVEPEGEDTEAESASEESEDSASDGETTEEDGGEEEYTGEVTTIRAVTSGSPAPYITVDEDNVPGGSDIDIIEEVFSRLPQYELEITVADDGLVGLTSGLYDIAVNNYGYREERAESYLYSYPYKFFYYVYIQRAGDEPLTSLQDLADRGYTIELGAGGTVTNGIEQWNEENPDSQINIIYTEATMQVKYQHIVDGTSDVAIDDGPIFDTLIPEYGLEDELIGNTLDDESQSFLSSSNYTYFLFAMDEAGEALRAEVDEALKEMKEDGTLAEILTGYFGRDTSPDAELFEETIN